MSLTDDASLPPIRRNLARAAAGIWPLGPIMRATDDQIHKLLRLPGSAHAAALGVAIGVFVATLPIVGVQIALAVAIAWALRANIPAAALGTFWANPITLPPLWFASYFTGCMMLRRTPAPSFDPVREFAQIKSLLVVSPVDALGALGERLAPLFLPLLIGSIPFALLLAAASYYITLRGIEAVRRREALAD